MLGLDTNVIVRYLTQDDPDQARMASAVIDALTPDHPGFVSAVVLAEVSWVLARSYKEPPETIFAAIDGLLRSNDLVVENAEAAYRALAVYRNVPRVDFADALIAQTGALAGASATVSFDKRACEAAGMRLLS